MTPIANPPLPAPAPPTAQPPGSAPKPAGDPQRAAGFAAELARAAAPEARPPAAPEARAAEAQAIERRAAEQRSAERTRERRAADRAAPADEPAADADEPSAAAAGSDANAEPEAAAAAPSRPRRGATGRDDDHAGDAPAAAWLAAPQHARVDTRPQFGAEPGDPGAEAAGRWTRPARGGLATAAAAGSPGRDPQGDATLHTAGRATALDPTAGGDEQSAATGERFADELAAAGAPAASGLETAAAAPILVNGAGGAAALALPHAAAPGDAVATATIAAPLDSPQFAPALGAQLSILVKDGMQHARLELNPAELGPILVQIQLDGSAAQVHMAADHASTRDALESALPSLAAALREEGLTLAGGGVFDRPREEQAGQPGERRGEAPARGGAGRAAATVDAAAAPPPWRRQGGIDLYA